METTFNTTYKATGPTKSSIKVTAGALPSELPVLPDPAVTNDDLKEMESKVDYWREQHADLGLKYDNLLQAFHIAETDVKLWKGTAKKARVEALNEAKLVAKTTCHHESTEFANGFNMAALNIESAIEALKGK